MSADRWLQAAGALHGVNVQRITFTEVTQQAVRQALGAPRAISQELVDAYLARRALDYLYGFTLSPLLWRKLPGSKSAGNGMLGLGSAGCMSRRVLSFMPGFCLRF